MKDYDEIACKIAENLVGHMAMESVTGYVVKHINEVYDMHFKDTSDLVEFAQKEDAEIIECEICGWYVDYVLAWEDSKGVCHDDVIGCEECLQYHEE